MDQVIINNSISNIDDLLHWYPGCKTFYLEPGTYNITKQFNIETDGLRIIGTTQDPNDVHIIQQTQNANGFNIRADNSTLQYLSIHVENGSGICVTNANTDWVTLANCKLYGSENNFTIFFAGKDYASDQELNDGFINDDMDSNNTIINNIIYSKWSGDAVSFALQKDGLVRNNIIRGGKLAIYMCKKSIVSHNKIYDTSSQGIYLSLPSSDVKVCNNIINDTEAASLKIAVQQEHDVIVYENRNIIIENNEITNSKYFGIEINDGSNININKNKIMPSKNFCIYLLRSNNINISNNICAFFSKGIVIDIECVNNTIQNNKLYSVFPDDSQNLIFLETGTSGNTISDNLLAGHTTSDTLKDLGTNTSTNNIIQEYINYIDEYITI